MTTSKASEAVDRLLKIMATLRSPGGCPWDAEQTPESLKTYILEEAYEVLEAIDRGEPEAICDELGDLLLQVVFQARIFEERRGFDMGDVANAIAEKMERRHPHVFGEHEARDPESLNVQWERIKKREKVQRGESTAALAGIPKALPALLRARKLSDRASRAGFDATGADGVYADVHRKLAEFEHTLQAGDQHGMEKRLGDILFAIVNLGRFVDIDAEEALRTTLDRFARRFAEIEKALAAEGRSIEQTSPEELNHLWDETEPFAAPERAEK